MDQFLNKITGGFQTGTNKIEAFNPTFHHQQTSACSSPPPGGIQWIFRRETLNQNDKIKLEGRQKDSRRSKIL